MRGFFDHPDPRVALGGTVALVIVGNQPFYPFSVAYVADTWVGPAFATWLSTPFFLLAPALARRRPDGGRALLLAAALGNTLLTALALGPASGVEGFYPPCLLLAALIFPRGRRLVPVLIAAALAAAGLVAARALTPWASLTPEQDHALSIMHAASALAITGFMLIAAWMKGRAGPSAPSAEAA